MFFLLACAWISLATLAYSQTVMLTPTNPIVVWAGVNTSNTLTIPILIKESGAAPGSVTNIVLNVSGTNAVTVFGRYTPTNNFTNNGSANLVIAVTNAALGLYPLTASSSGDGVYTTNFNLFIVPQWTTTNQGQIGNWSDVNNWSAGAVPTINDGVYFERQIGGVSFTNIVDSSRTIQSLVLIGDADDNSGVVGMNTVIPGGSTLSVVGTNGFFLGVKNNNNTRPNYLFSGAGALVVSNPVANFVIANGAGGSSTRPVNFNMTNLNSFSATVNRFGVGDATLDNAGLAGGVMVSFFFAKTNTIMALYADDYNGLNFENSFQYQANGEAASGSLNPTCNLGLTNGFYMDSLGVGRSKVQGSAGVGFGGGGSTLKFAQIYSNSVAPIATAIFRNTNGGRMNLVAVGVDSGTNSAASVSTKGTIDLRGGKTDMLVDQIWVGRNRSNATAPSDLGAFLFDGGSINANTVRAGYYQYTNGATVQGFILVGTNGVLTVNNYIELSHRPAVLTNGGFDVINALAFGQLQATNGGVIRANSIIVGTNSGNNQILLASGGGLVLTNTAGDSTNKLAAFTANGSSVTFNLDGSVNTTNIFAKSIVFSGSPNVINIATVANLTPPQRFTLMSFDAAASAPAFTKGAVPLGFNGTVGNTWVNGSTPGIVYIDITTGVPKTLIWRGYQNANWDHSSTNWWDPVALTTTNTFNDGDFVIFDDSATGSTTINVTESVSPGQQVGVPGVAVTNNTLAYTLNNGGGSIGLSSLNKSGTGTFTLNCSSTLTAQINQGMIAGGASGGKLGGVTVASGAAFSFSGTINGSLACSGIATNSGSIVGSISVGDNASVYNIGSLDGGVSVGANAFLYNQGNMIDVGNISTATNSTFVNSGNITGGGMSISGTYQDNGSGSLKFSNVMTINGNGVFMVGNADGSSQVTVNNNGSTTTFPQAGRVLLSNGSTNYFGVNTDNSNPNGNANELLMISVDFGNNNTLSGGGGVIVITNKGVAPFAAGQSFKLFGSDDGDANDPFYEAGTNTAPVIRPGAPGPGLAWDTRTLRADGIIKVISVGTSLPVYGFSPVITNNMILFLNFTTNVVSGVTNVTANYSTNKSVITTLNWPATNVGWRLQQQIDSLSIGIRSGDSNWSYIYPSWWTNTMYVTNTFSSNQAIFFRLTYP